MPSTLEQLSNMPGNHLASLENPLIGHSCQEREMHSLREGRNLLLIQCSLVAEKEKDSEVSRPCGFTVENHKQVEKKTIFLFFKLRLIKVQIFSSLWSLAS